ncbi:hypothetical protein BN381_190002 [Candidatus Microthrix parvicella RN1]|uniref:Uncharacterized protein n=1 Tax=Candidatus Neomicrothrix parvicella RN1 TaxID=1229780 RepID=R4YXW5_9ACTN|nr:hypothetical protein BN381_190002 [Candidatus Microthrix parvicella RN1]
MRVECASTSTLRPRRESDEVESSVIDGGFLVRNGASVQDGPASGTALGQQLGLGRGELGVVEYAGGLHLSEAFQFVHQAVTRSGRGSRLLGSKLRLLCRRLFGGNLLLVVLGLGPLLLALLDPAGYRCGGTRDGGGSCHGSQQARSSGPSSHSAWHVCS